MPCEFVLEAPEEVHRYSSEDNCQRLRSKLAWPPRVIQVKDVLALRRYT